MRATDNEGRKSLIRFIAAALIGSQGFSQLNDLLFSNCAAVKPEPKFRFTAAMRMHLFSIMSLNTEIVERQTDKAWVELN